MKTLLVYYISEYGYGHATRSVAMIRELLNRNALLKIIICNQFALPFLKESLKEYGDRVLFHEVKTDVGYVLKEGTLELDPMAMNVQYRDYITAFPDLVKEEWMYLKSFSPEGILSDVSPLGFAVGKELGIHCAGISNFTWAGACQHVVDPDIHQWLVNQYSQADFFYRLAGFNEELDIPYQDVGFFSRKVDIAEVFRLKREYDIQPNESVVFVSIGMKIDVEEVNSWPLWSRNNCRFIVSNVLNVSHPNVISIPTYYTESQNFIALSDVVITKASWGTVSEAVINHKRLMIINRDMEEDQNTLAYLQRNYRVNVIEYDDLKNGYIEM